MHTPRRSLKAAITLCAFALFVSQAIGKTEAVLLGQPGKILAMELNVSKCEVFAMELTFATKDLSPEDQLRLIGNGARRGYQEYVNPGITVPLGIRIVRYESSGSGGSLEVEVKSWQAKTQGISALVPKKTASRSAGAITLPRGTYRVDVELLQAVPELSAIPASFSVGSSFKVSPRREECS